MCINRFTYCFMFQCYWRVIVCWNFSFTIKIPKPHSSRKRRSGYCCFWHMWLQESIRFGRLYILGFLEAVVSRISFRCFITILEAQYRSHSLYTGSPFKRWDRAGREQNSANAQQTTTRRRHVYSDHSRTRMFCADGARAAVLFPSDVRRGNLLFSRPLSSCVCW